jgi:hypothetical protein
MNPCFQVRVAVLKGLPKKPSDCGTLFCDNTYAVILFTQYSHDERYNSLQAKYAKIMQVKISIIIFYIYFKLLFIFYNKGSNDVACRSLKGGKICLQRNLIDL